MSEDKNIDKLYKLTLNSLKEQRKSCMSVLDGYKKLEENLKVELLPFLVIANKNLLNVIEKQIEILEKRKE